MGKQDSFGFELTTEDGFTYVVNQESISVSFVHRLKLKNRSGDYPVAEMISRPQPYTKLLPIVCERLLEVTALLINPKYRFLEEIGIVTSTIVDEDEAPPGIHRFNDYVGKPWSNELDAYGLQIVARLNDHSDKADRCIHNISRAENEDGLVNLRFDWQRKFKNQHPIPTTERLSELFKTARKDALAYFEELAEGDRF